MILDHKKTRRILGVFACAVAVSAGCQGAGSRSRTVKADSTLSGNIGDEDVVGDSPTVSATPAPSGAVSYVDRHPLLSKPRQYWESSGDNKIVKAAAATFVGVPVGFAGEVKQIFVGAPPETIR